MNRTSSMKLATIAVFVTALAVPFAKAQQTQTNCTVNSNTVNCTSNSTPTFQQSMDSFNKSMQATANSIAATRQANMNDKVKIEYCHQNPGGSITTGSGQIRGCVDAIAYVKAACDVRKWKGLCGKDWAWIKTFTPPSPISSASIPVDQSALDAMFSADRAKDYCSQHPNDNFYYPAPRPSVRCREILASPSSPARDATTAPPAPISSGSPAPVTAPPAPAPLTAEQKDAISYCTRNPNATITWNDGTVSPCSSVLGLP